MSRLFISHSSWNNDKAVEVRDWLAKNGWGDVFLDLDPVGGIAAGQRWKEALQKAAYRCEVVLALVSKEWLASSWCKAEVDAARLIGKKVIAALVGIDKSQVPTDLTDEQYIDLTGDPDAYPRLKEGLKRAGLDPTTFPFPPGRRPYPGFAYLEEEDAAVFFGRDAQIVRGLDEIRRLARAGVTRMFVILGASGSGKSSFLRAGLWPRLKRDDLAWLPLPVIRPERAAISGSYGLVQAVQQAVNEPRFAESVRQRGLPQARADILDFVEKTQDGLAKLLTALREIAQAGMLSDGSVVPPTVLIAVDQGEELFNEEGRKEARRLIEILTRTLAADRRALTILVMRSDAFPLVQGDPTLAALPKDVFTLDMMLEGSFRAVIEGPARLVEPRLKIDPLLTDALLEDISGQDALPLLAFTLAHLYDNYRAGNELTLAGYERIGRVKGVIDKTVALAFAEAAAKGEAPKDATAQLTLARSAFIPQLVQVNDAGEFVRRVALREKIPDQARPLIDRFAERRLLIKDRRQDAEVIEVAHEALLRQPPFSQWLEDDREFLKWRERVSHARAAFEAKERSYLGDRELAIASGHVQARESEIEPTDLAFISASQRQQRKREERRIRDAERIIEEQKKALAHLREAQISQSHFLIDKAWQYREAGDAGTSILLALEALPDSDGGIDRPYIPQAELQLDRAWRDLRERLDFSHEREVYSAAFSPDGKRIVTACFDKTARLWDAETGCPLGSPLRGHGNVVFGAAFSPDGERIATSSSDNTARLWDAATGEPIGEPLTGHENSVLSVSFSPDGKRIVTASMDKTARLWDAATGRPIGEPLSGAAKVMFSAMFSPDGKRIIAASEDGTARLRDAATGEPIGEPLTGHEDSVLSVSFSPDGKRIVTASMDKTARLWDAATGRPIGEPLRGHMEVVLSATFSPDGKRIVTASWDRTAQIWDAETGRPIGKPIRGHEKRLSSAAFSPDGKCVVTASDDNTARVWSTEISQPVGESLKGHDERLSSAPFSPDGKRIVTVSHDGTARLWDAATGGAIGEPFGDHESYVFSAAFSPDGTRVVTASDDETARLWDAATGQPIGEPLRGHTGGVWSAAFSPDGTRVVTASDDNTARQWDVATGLSIGEPLRDRDKVKTAAYSPDGKWVVTGSDDGTARVWDAATGQPIGEPLRGHTGAVWSAAFSPDGKLIVTGSFDGTARLWDAATYQRIGQVLAGHVVPVMSVAFSPDGKRIVTASDDKTVRLWDAGTGLPISEPLRGHTKAVSRAVFSPDGKRMVTASDDKTVRLWDIPADTQALVAEAKQRVPRCLTPAQRKAFFLPPKPPAWCIEMAKWPYNTPEWKQWLADKRAGNNPPLPGGP